MYVQILNVTPLDLDSHASIVHYQIENILILLDDHERTYRKRIGQLLMSSFYIVSSFSQ